MAAAARFLTRGANSKLSISGIGTGAQSSFGVTLLKLSPSCNSRTKTQRRHASHFTFQPDPVPTQYGEWQASRLTLAAFTEETCEAVKVSVGNLCIDTEKSSRLSEMNIFYYLLPFHSLSCVSHWTAQSGQVGRLVPEYLKVPSIHSKDM